MKVIRADKCGFCFGVRRAMELAVEQCRGSQKVYSLGPLIHNPQVIEKLHRQGLEVIDSADSIRSGTVVIRSHGVSSAVIESLRARGISVVDATCPLVKRAQERARVLAREGYTVVIVGEEDHPEVQAILADVPGAVVVEDNVPESLRSARRVGVIAQTTQAPATYRGIVSSMLQFDFDELRVFNTICSATVDRQQAALDLAGRVDVMFVLGGRNSANTERLAQLCASTGVPTFHLETVAELQPEMTVAKRIAGVTAGASTPDWIIDEFVKTLEAL